MAVQDSKDVNMFIVLPYFGHHAPWECKEGILTFFMALLEVCTEEWSEGLRDGEAGSTSSEVLLGKLGPEQLSQYSDWLRARWSGDRIPVVSEIFPHASRPALGPTYTIGTWSFPGVKRPGRGVDHPSPSSAEVNFLKTKRNLFYIRNQFVP